MINKLLLICIACSWACVAGATDYYVTESGAGSHNGSVGNEWSWSEIDGNGTISAGDTVYFSGDFDIDLDANGDCDISQSGNAGSGHIVFDGSNSSDITVVNTTGGEYSVFSLGSSDYIELVDFTIRTGSGNTSKPRIMSAGSADNIKVHGFDANGTFSHGLYGLNGISNWEIYENQIINANTYQSASSDAITIINGNDVSIHNNVFSNWHHGALGMPTRDGDEVYEVDIYFNYYSQPLNHAFGGYPMGIIAFSGTTGNSHDVYFHHNFIEASRNHLQLGYNNVDIYVYYNVWHDIRNCCENAADDGCDYGEATTSCSVYYEFFKTGQGVAAGNGATDIYIFNNTMSELAEGGIQLNPQGAAVGPVYITNNIINDAANACDGDAEGDPHSSPDGSDSAWTDSSISAYGGETLTFEIKNNIINTDTGGTADNDFDWPGEAPANIATFEANHNSEPELDLAEGNIDGDPGFVSSTQLWPDTSSSAIGSGLSLTSAPYNSLPMYDQVIDPDNTDFTAVPPVVVTKTQPGSWYIGAYGQEIAPDTTPPAAPVNLSIANP